MGISSLTIMDLTGDGMLDLALIGRYNTACPVKLYTIRWDGALTRMLVGRDGAWIDELTSGYEEGLLSDINDDGILEILTYDTLWELPFQARHSPHYLRIWSFAKHQNAWCDAKPAIPACYQRQAEFFSQLYQAIEKIAASQQQATQSASAASALYKPVIDGAVYDLSELALLSLFTIDNKIQPEIKALLERWN